MTNLYMCSSISHSDAISQLENCKNNFLLGLFALNLFTSSENFKRNGSSSCSFGRFTVNSSQIIEMLEENNEIACREYLKLHLRALIKESFEVVTQYCKQENLYEVMRNQEWFHFARIIRNAIAHSGHFKIEKDRFYGWRDFQLSHADHGQPLKIDFIGYEGAYLLYEELYIFLKSLSIR